MFCFLHVSVSEPNFPCPKRPFTLKITIWVKHSWIAKQFRTMDSYSPSLHCILMSSGQQNCKRMLANCWLTELAGSRGTNVAKQVVLSWLRLQTSFWLSWDTTAKFGLLPHEWVILILCMSPSRTTPTPWLIFSLGQTIVCHKSHHLTHKLILTPPMQTWEGSQDPCSLLMGFNMS